jgi:hypothetical protein
MAAPSRPAPASARRAACSSAVAAPTTPRRDPTNQTPNSPFSFATYGANGFTATDGNSTSILTATGNLLNGNTLRLGDGSHPAGLILNGGASITNGTLNFADCEGIIWFAGQSNNTNTISAAINGSGGLTFVGGVHATNLGNITKPKGLSVVNINTASTETGSIIIDAGAVTLNAVNVFSSSAPGVFLQDIKSSPSPATLNITRSNQFGAVSSAGNNSSINVSGAGVQLIIGDGNNENSSLSSTITQCRRRADQERHRPARYFGRFGQLGHWQQRGGQCRCAADRQRRVRRQRGRSILGFMRAPAYALSRTLVRRRGLAGLRLGPIPRVKGLAKSRIHHDASIGDGHVFGRRKDRLVRPEAGCNAQAPARIWCDADRLTWRRCGCGPDAAAQVARSDTDRLAGRRGGCGSDAAAQIARTDADRLTWRRCGWGSYASARHALRENQPRAFGQEENGQCCRKKSFGSVSTHGVHLEKRPSRALVPRNFDAARVAFRSPPWIFCNLLPNGYSKGAEKGLQPQLSNDGISMMALQITATGTSVRSELALIGASVRSLVQRLRAAIVQRAQVTFDPYRPELHYMRGPGPKWREKHRMTTPRGAER